MQYYGIWFIGSNGDILFSYEDYFVNRNSAVFWADRMVDMHDEYKTYVLKEIVDNS